VFGLVGVVFKGLGFYCMDLCSLVIFLVGKVFEIKSDSLFIVLSSFGVLMFGVLIFGVGFFGVGFFGLGLFGLGLFGLLSGSLIFVV